MHSCVTFSCPAGTIDFSVTYILLTFSCWDCIEVMLLLPPGVTSGDRLSIRNLQKWSSANVLVRMGISYRVEKLPLPLTEVVPHDLWAILVLWALKSYFHFYIFFIPLTLIVHFSGSAGLWDPGISLSVAAIWLHCSPVKHPSLLLGVSKNSIGQPGTAAGKIERGCKRQYDQSRQEASVSVLAAQWANSETSEKRSGWSACSKKQRSSSNFIFLNWRSDQKLASDSGKRLPLRSVDFGSVLQICSTFGNQNNFWCCLFLLASQIPRFC